MGFAHLLLVFAAAATPDDWTVAGRVLRADGTPAAGATVALIRLFGSEDEVPVRRRTGSDGSFVVTWHARSPEDSWDPFRLAAESEDGAALTGFFYLGDGRVPMGDIRLSPRTSIRVEVVDQDGAPITRPWVSLEVRGAGEGDGVDRPLPDPHLEMYRLFLRKEPDGPGRFISGPLPARADLTARVTAAAEGCCEVRRDLGPLDTAGPVRVVLPRARKAHGVLLEATGKPPRFVSVGDRFDPPSDGALFDPPDGLFRATGLPASGASILLTAMPGHRHVVLPVPDGKPGEDVDLGTVTLPPTFALRGRVVDENGNPPGGMHVCARGKSQTAIAFTADDGRFALAGLDAGFFSVSAQDIRDGVPRRAECSAVVPGEVDVVLRLSSTGQVVLKFLTDRATRAPLEVLAPKVWIDGRPEDMPWRSDHAWLDTPRPGKHEIRVVAARCKPRVLRDVEFAPDRLTMVEVLLLPR